MEAKKDQKNWAEMEDEADAEEEFGINKDEKPKKTVPKNTQVKNKNNQGDFIVTTFDVDATVNYKGEKDENEEKAEGKKGLELDSDSDSDYGQEEEKEADVIVEEPKKKEGKYSVTHISLEVKVLSKKEKKALEDAEFEALLGGAAPVKEEAKTDDKKPQEAATGGANAAKNKKKKEAKKKREAEAAAAAKAEEEKV